MDFGSAFVLSTPVNPAVDFEEIDESDYSAGVRSAMDRNISGRQEGMCFLDIIDSAGQEEYSSLRENYMRTAQAVLIVFSITSRETFERAKTMYEFCCRFRGTTSTPVVLCANKCDLEWQRQVSEYEALQWANSKGIPIFNTSAKQGTNIEKAFIKLVQITPRTGVEYKIAVLGDGGVGKSAIVVRFTINCFVETYDPTIEDGFRKQMIVPDLPPLVTSSGNATPNSKTTRGSHSKGPSTSNVVSKAAKRSSGFFSSLFRSGSRSSASHTSPPSYDQATITTVGDRSSGIVPKCRKIPKKDTNVLVLSLGTLSAENFDMLEVKALTSPPPACPTCSAILSASPTCVFCNTHNRNVSHLEIRRAAEEYTLIQGLQSASPRVGNVSTGTVADVGDKGLVVFCVDVSGSMAIQQKVKQLQSIWQSLKTQEQNQGVSPTSAQPQNGSEVISRLECIQDAMQVHLDRLEKYFPERKVAIVAFDSRLECYMGRDTSLQVIDPNDFKDIHDGMDAARRFKPVRWRTVKENIAPLRNHVKGLVTKGSTALGPALALALGLAREHKQETGAATEIFLCTDGASNTGIGSTDQLHSNYGIHGRPFYSRAGEIALGQSAKINIIGIVGEGVALDVLAVAAQISGGVVTTVQADELRREIRTASQRRIIAKDVTIKLFSHKGWNFVPDPRPGVAVSKNTLAYTLAQIDDETSVGFAFGVNPGSDSKAGAIAGTIPFQAQITYTSPNTGDTNVRVLNRVVPVTADREHAEAAVEVALTGTHALQRIAFDANHVLIQNLSFGGDAKSRIGALRDSLYATHQLLIRGAKTNQQQEELGIFSHESAQLDSELERMMSGGAYGSSRDQAARTFARVTALSRSALLAGSKKAGQVKRRQVLK